MDIDNKNNNNIIILSMKIIISGIVDSSSLIVNEMRDHILVHIAYSERLCIDGNDKVDSRQMDK